MERTDILSPSLNWLELVGRVQQDGVTVELFESDKLVAKITPPRKISSMQEFANFMNSLPPLGDDAEAFEADLLAADQEMLPLDDPWHEE